MMKKLIILLMAALLLLSAAVTACAIEAPDRDRKGSLTLVLEQEGKKLSGGTMTVFRVGQIVYEDSAWTFALIPELRDSDIDLEDLTDAQLAKQLDRLIKEKKLPGITVPVEKGRAVFEELTPGLYLVNQEKACEGFAPINPFLISLPQWENGRYVYDLTAQPKVSLEPLPPETTKPTEPKETKPGDSTEPAETEPVPALPQTGQLNWPIPVMAATGLALFTLGWYLCYGKKNCHES